MYHFVLSIVNWAWYWRFIVLRFILTGDSTPGLSSTLITIRYILPTTPCPITWFISVPSNTFVCSIKT